MLEWFGAASAYSADIAGPGTPSFGRPAQRSFPDWARIRHAQTPDWR